MDELQPGESPRKKLCLAILLLILGIGLTVGGIDVVYRKEKGHGFALIVLGVLVLIPGVYYTKVGYHAVRGNRGYTFDSIPDV